MNTKSVCQLTRVFQLLHVISFSPTKRLGSLAILFCPMIVIIAPMMMAGDNLPIKVSMRVDFGEDVGQAWGTLWEATDSDGRTIAGAGFQNAYNTQDRSDRRMLQIFVRTHGRPDFRTTPLPRPTTDAGTYLYGSHGQLFSYGRNAIDHGLRRWDSHTNQWSLDVQTAPLSVDVAGLPLFVTTRQIRYGDRIVLELPNKEEVSTRFGEWYYAAGTLLVRHFSDTAEGGINDLLAFAWTPSQTIPLKIQSGIRQPLPKWGEFIYCFGQVPNHHSHPSIVTASNQGSVHSFHRGQWNWVRHPDGKSFQIYSSINFQNRLLLGHYPTGELVEWSESGLMHLPQQPPVMEGVSRHAREAQTMAIYGGELHVGVWPWGELWRQNSWNHQWEFLGRLFTHPDPTDQWTHPYEPETQALDPVLNRWGQRVTSMVPMGQDLIMSTSAKGPNPFEEKFTFLGGGKHLEYGGIHRFHSPGCLSIALEWKNQPTQIDFEIGPRSLQVKQDGKLLGFTEWSAEFPKIDHQYSMVLGKGTFGPFGGQSVQLLEEPISTSVKELRAAYVHVHRHIHPQSDPVEWSKLVRSTCDQMKDFELNALMPFVSDSSGRAHFASHQMPRYYPSGDPIALFATELRNRRIDFCPVLPVVVCGGDEPSGILLEHPQWALRHPDGSPMGYISPAHPAARQWLVGVVRELISGYSPDGLVFDYLRYANRPHRLDADSEHRFQSSLPPDCSPDEEQRLLQRFKEAELTELVRMLAETARQLDPRLRLSAYVWGHHVANNHLIAQVWPEWVAAGYLDEINVSGYCHRQKYGDRYLEEFRKRMLGAVELNRSLPKNAALSFALGVVTSHGSAESADDIRQYQRISQELGMNGWSYFTWEYLQPFIDELKAK